MTDVRSPEGSPTTGLGIGVYFLAGPPVVALAGIGGYFGERLWGGPGYWIGCYVVGIVVAAAVSLVFAKLFHGKPLYWALGALGLLVGGHLTWAVLGGKVGEAPASGSDQLLIGCAALVGMLLGFAIAHPIVARRQAKCGAETVRL